jgi:tetratricopeptide (TPR) repeat protein
VALVAVRTFAALLGLLGAVVHPLLAQQQGMSRAFDLERRGDYPAAADAYRAVLAGAPGEPGALLGLERVLLPLDRSAEILPLVRAGLAANPRSGPLYGVALRAWAAVDQPDSMRAVVERWAAIARGDETPYREWGAAALGRHDRSGALEAYTRGRERLHQTDALAAEMAQLVYADGNYTAALKEWLAAVRRVPGYRVTAIATLGQAPEDARPALLGLLQRESDLPARRLEAELRVRWGQPLAGLEVLERALPENQALAIEALRGVLDQLRPLQTREGKLAQAHALEELARRTPDGEGSRLRLEAARVYSGAGDRESARRMLAGLAGDRNAPEGVSAGAATTLVNVLIAEGKLDEAGRRLTEIQPTTAADELAGLRRRLVLGWVRAGELARADSTLGADSTVEGFALRGEIRLYQGDVAGAVESFKTAGPYAGERVDATQRTALLALLQPMEADSLPALGRALLTLAQGDTAGAAARLERAGADLPPAKGGAEVRLLAGRLYARAGKPGDAERLFHVAAAPEAPGTAPAAELALAELMIEQGRTGDAIPRLEHLILTYPESALVPEARRRLDQARGAVPKT